MNANELGDKLNNSNTNGNLCDEAATMLRQQQAEIEALKAAKIRAYNNGVEDGRKPDTNNEPVAWAVWEGRPHDLFFTKEDADELCRLKGGDAKSVPLYTHPVKELTNKEIEEIAKEFKDVDYTLDEEEAFDVFNHRGFARAILRKAQDK